MSVDLVSMGFVVIVTVNKKDGEVVRWSFPLSGFFVSKNYVSLVMRSIALEIEFVAAAILL